VKPLVLKGAQGRASLETACRFPFALVRVFTSNFQVNLKSNWSNDLLDKEQQVKVTVHEMGHNLGSFHDPPECGEEAIMDEFGGDKTLDKFSNCSRAYIGTYMKRWINSHCVTEGTTKLGNTGAVLKRRSRSDSEVRFTRIVSCDVRHK
jgi:hypothetical protein